MDGTPERSSAASLGDAAGGAAIEAKAKLLLHDVRNALNGIAVSVEAVRLRLEGVEGQEASVRMLGHAAQQVDVTATLGRQLADLVSEALRVGVDSERTEHHT